MFLWVAATLCIVSGSLSSLFDCISGLADADPELVLSRLDDTALAAYQVESELMMLRSTMKTMRERAELQMEQSLDSRLQRISSVFERVFKSPHEVMDALRWLEKTKSELLALPQLSERLIIKVTMALSTVKMVIDNLRLVQMAIGVMGYVINSTEKDLSNRSISGYIHKLEHVCRPSLPLSLRKSIKAHLTILANDKLMTQLRRYILSLHNIDHKLNEVTKVLEIATREYTPITENALVSLLSWRAHFYRLSADKESRRQFFPDIQAFTDMFKKLSVVFNAHATWLLPAYRASRGLDVLPFASPVPTEAFLMKEKSFNLEKEASALFGNAALATLASLWCTSFGATSRFIPPGESLEYHDHELLNKINLTLMPNQIELSKVMFPDANHLVAAPIVSYRDYVSRRLKSMTS